MGIAPIAAVTLFPYTPPAICTSIENCMNKKRRRVKLIILLLSVATVCLGLWGYMLLKGTPDYYIMLALTPEQKEAAAQRAEDTINRMQNLAAAAHGAELRASTNPASALEKQGATFSFSQDEINSLFNKWSEKFGWPEMYARYLKEPVIILKDKRIILAGRVTVRQIDSVVSFHFQPKITADGELDLNMTDVRGGNLPLPRDMLVSPLREKAIDELQRRVPEWQQRARIDSHGGANDDTMKLALGQLVISLLEEKPAESVMFLPVFQESRRVPANLSDVKIENQTLIFTVVPMDAAQREQLLTHLKEPVDFASMRE